MLVRGAKGGGGGTPTEASDTLRSTQRAEIVDVLGEGQIGGLVNGLKSVYLDGVPVENADGSKNFKDFAFDVTLGGPTDTAPAQGFGDVQTEVGVAVTVTAALPVVRTIADATVSAVRVTITVPALVETKDNGDRVGSSFEWAIDVQSAGGGYVTKHSDTIAGKASAAYSRSVKVDLTGPAPWNVRVRRITADSTSANVVNAFAWTSYTAISGVRMLYRNSATARLSFDAQNFSAMPTRAYDLMGSSDWDVPINYDPIARTVAGSWSGLFKQAWTNNPAWVLYNLVQHPRYGLGQYITALPDKWVLYQLAQWCDAPVPNGRGGTEPRYTINAYLQQQSEALRLLQDICAVFRGAVLYAGGTLGVTWDRPQTPAAIYAPANVVNGLFNYADGSRASKKSSCTCWYNDRSQFGKRMPATWDDPGLVAKYGLRSMEIDPIGVASPSQALRMAKWALWTTELEDATVAFRVGSQGVAGRVGDVFQINDPSETGERLGGRVHAATTTAVTLDHEVTLAAGETYTLWVTLADPADPAKLIAQERTVTNAAGTHTTLTVASAFTAAPMAQTMWLLDGSDVAPTLWTYLSIQEVRGEANQIEYEIVGLRHLSGKWDFIENNQPLTVRPTRRLSDAAPKPTGVSIAETNFLDGVIERIRATVSWTMPAQGLRYLVAWRQENGPWTALPPTSSNTVQVSDLQPGRFDARVQSVNVLGNVSLPVEASLDLTGTTLLPPNVTGLSAVAVPAGIEVRWDLAPSAGETELRYGADWASGTPLFRGRANTWTAVAPPPATYQLWAKNYDLTGERESPTATSVTIIWDGVNLFSVLVLTASSQIFKVDPAGAATPTTITLTAGGQNLVGDPAWSIVAGTATLTGPATASTRTLAFANMATDMVTVQVDWDGQSDRVTLFKLKDGSDAISWGLINEDQSIPCDEAGTPLVAVNVTSQLVVARGATILTTGVAYSVVSSTGLESAGTTTGASANVAIHASTGVITVTKITSDSASATFRATIGTTVVDAKLTISKVRAGISGGGISIQSTAGSVFLTSASGTSYTPASIILSRALRRVTDPSAAGTVWAVTSGNFTGSLAVINGATGAFASIEPNEMTTDSVTFRCTVTDSVTGLVHTDEITVVKSRDTVSGYLTNESHTVPANSSGTVLDYTGASGVFKVLNASGDVAPTGGNPAFSIIGHSGFTVTFPATSGISIDGAGNYGVTANVASGTAPARVTFRAAYTDPLGGVKNVDRVFTVTKANQGSPGSPGNPGTAGASFVRAYALFTGNPVVTGSPVVTSGTTLPSAAAWSPSAATAWTSTTQAPAAGQAMFQTDGRFDPVTNTTTWQVPYLSNLRVGSLSALAADLGTINAGSITGASFRTAISGARTEINVGGSNNLISYDATGDAFFMVIPSAPNVQIYGAATSVNALLRVYDEGIVGQAAEFRSQGSSKATLTVMNDFGAGKGFECVGSAAFTGRIVSAAPPGSAPFVLPVFSSKPPPVSGGVALHSGYGLIVSDGVNWFGASSLITLP